MRFVNWRSGAECGVLLAIDREWEKVEQKRRQISCEGDGALWLRSEPFQADPPARARAGTPLRRERVEGEKGLRAVESFS